MKKTDALIKSQRRVINLLKAFFPKENVKEKDSRKSHPKGYEFLTLSAKWLSDEKEMLNLLMEETKGWYKNSYTESKDSGLESFDSWTDEKQQSYFKKKLEENWEKEISSIEKANKFLKELKERNEYLKKLETEIKQDESKLKRLESELKQLEEEKKAIDEDIRKIDVGTINDLQIKFNPIKKNPRKGNLIFISNSRFGKFD